MRKLTLYRTAGILVLALSALWSGYAILADGPVVDESPHLAAGISYVENLNYRLNPEHPPLPKLAAGLFAHLAGPVLPTDAEWWQGGINEQWRAGEVMLWGGANDPGKILAFGRLGVTLLNFALLIVGWRFVSRRYGEPWGLGFAVLAGASPFFLGHAHLVTTDVTAAAAAVIACFTFTSFVKNPTWKTGAVAAAAFGFAQLAKFSLVLLIPTFIIVAAVLALQSHGRSWKPLLRKVGQACAVMLAGFALVVYPVYAVLTWNSEAGIPERDTSFLLSSFAGGPKDGILCNPMRCLADATVLASEHAITRPAGTYALGVLMVVQRSAGGNTTYFNGDTSSSGSRLYFPYVYLGKETIPALLVIAGGLGVWLARKRRTWGETGKGASPELVMGTFAVLYVLSTLNSSLNIGVRHLFPVVPIVYLFAITGWKHLSERFPHAETVFVALLALHVASAAASLPTPLASYNALAGGERGYLVAADSNYDWGQDAVRLREWIDAHPEAGTVAVDVFGASRVEGLVGERGVEWKSHMGNPAAYGIRYIAISISPLLTATGVPVPGEPRLVENEYRWLKALRGVPYGEVPEPDAKAGASFFIYDLEK